MWDFRRKPRLGVEAFCTEIVDGRERHGTVLDVSEEGVRLTRPFVVGQRRARDLQLEFELPGIDEVMWARGEICFDQLKPGKLGLIRTTGVRLARAAARDLRMLRDYVMGMTVPMSDEQESDVARFLRTAVTIELG
jgi:hypothetical protein